MNKQYLGIDLGTSAVKLLLVTPDGDRKRAKCSYVASTPKGWCDALKNAVAMLKQEDPLTGLSAIALSSQVGTYLTDTEDVIGWQSAVGKEELDMLKDAVSGESWKEQIGMVHPDLISYPLPRLLYIRKHFPECTAVKMPKEMLLQELTGQCITDIFSWRGLCHPDKKTYAEPLLQQFGISVSLPPLAEPTDQAGCITAAAAKKYGLPEKTPVYVGCNDFFAGLLGMGVWETGSVFELSGTSEHLGVISTGLQEGAFVSGRFFNGFATYGGTKSSGASCEFAMDRFGIEGIETEIVTKNPPIFLPYLKGERAPIYDENAKGVFFGITDQTSHQDMAYAVLEGVVFSLYHIGQALDLSGVSRMITGGGSAANPMMARLKAALFNCDVMHVTENDSSALGAAMLAMVGSGEYATLAEAIRATVTWERTATPDRKLRELLVKRYELYKKLYTDLKDSFAIFSKL